MNLARRLAAEAGEGVVSALLLLGGVMLPLLFVVASFARVEEARFAVDQAAADAVRAATLAPNQAAADEAAQGAATRAAASGGVGVEVTLLGVLQPGSTMTATAVAEVPLGVVPFLGGFGTVAIVGQAEAPVGAPGSLGAVGPG